MSTDLDKIHKKRIDTVIEKWRDDDDDLNNDDIFISELVINSLDNEKALIESFNLPRILALLPFTPIVYIEICPRCIRENNLQEFKALVNSGLVIPVLVHPYNQYPEQVIDTIRGRDHVSCYEYRLYRNATLQQIAGGGLCGHCVTKESDKLKEVIKGKRKAPEYRKHLDHIMYNLIPFVPPDYELLDDIGVAFNDVDMERLLQLKDMSSAIHSFRNAQAFNAAVTIDEKDLTSVPEGITDENDKARQLGFELRNLVTDGLGLKIPTDIKIEQYVELLKDFRPQIINTTNNVIDTSSTEGELSIKKLLGSIASINTEIERIKGLKKYMLYEAGVEFVGKNKTLVASAFVASAMGLAGSFIGCMSTATAGAAVNIAKKKGKLQSGKSISRLSTKIHRDLQPNLDKLISRYVGTEVPTMRVLSIRKAIDEHK